MRKVVAEEEKRNWVFRWPRNINHVQPCEAKERHDAAAEINKLNCRPSNFAFKKLLESRDMCWDDRPEKALAFAYSNKEQALDVLEKRYVITQQQTVQAWQWCLIIWLSQSMQGAGKVPEHAETKAGELREGSWWSVS
ncbi:hypothetical protein V6N11_078605 [Hibiscus sabdariffa]|uniref:Uncharacterized protein n=2 Tax=Hibiscus sabdariffa TaxID=183260 RepID=A0ABR1ZHY4_9ROSI